MWFGFTIRMRMRENEGGGFGTRNNGEHKRTNKQRMVTTTSDALVNRLVFVELLKIVGTKKYKFLNSDYKTGCRILSFCLRPLNAVC